MTAASSLSYEEKMHHLELKDGILKHVHLFRFLLFSILLFSGGGDGAGRGH